MTFEFFGGLSDLGPEFGARRSKHDELSMQMNDVMLGLKHVEQVLARLTRQACKRASKR